MSPGLHRTLPIAVPLLAADAAAADPVEQFFARRTVTITIGYTAGGSYDLYGRMVARHLGKHIPGQPTVIAQNMPGAGSLKAANYLYEVAPKDGTALGLPRAIFLRTVTHLREGDHGPRPHQLIERCSSQKQKPGSERDSKVGDESN
jgi:tripartite-type tricarboxylate transporter receptor subunit TctC